MEEYIMKTLKSILFFVFSLIIMNVQSQIIHVPGDQPTIQAGIDAANFYGDTVLVADGEYFENIDFSGKGITVASEFIIDGDTNHINNTIIDGSQPANLDNGSVVYFQNWEDTTSILCGFTITGGTGTWVEAANARICGGIFIQNCGAKIIRNHIHNNHIVSSGLGIGGGISAGDNLNNDYYVVIKHNRITNNTITANNLAEGGGISLYCHGTIAYNVISHNKITSQNYIATGGGIRWINDQSLRYINCSYNIVTHNTSVSGSYEYYGRTAGMEAYKCEGNISNNYFQFNENSSNFGSFAGGILVMYCGSSLVLENNIISDNVANIEPSVALGGGIYLFSSSIQLINNVIARNYAEYGAAIYSYLNLDGPTQFINNTIADNEGDGDGSAIYLEDADAIVLNSILWNDGNEIYVSGGSIEVAYSNILDDWIGVGNINEDPVFLDPEYHLAWPSKCIGAGTESIEMGGVTYNCPATDFDGEPRPQCVLVDIGADESPFWVGITEKAEQENNLKTTPNPTSGIININYKIQDRGETSLSILNMSGELVETNTPAKQIPGEQSLQFDLSHLPNGLYLIRLQAGTQMETTKIILHK